MKTRMYQKTAPIVAAEWLSAMSRKIATIGILAASIAAASAGNFSTGTTNVINPVGVAVTDATGNMVSYATFTNNVAQAFATNYAGVWNFDVPSGWSLANAETATLSYGLTQSSNLVLTGSFINGDSVNQQGPSGGTITTSGSYFLGQNGAYQDQRSFVPNKYLAAVGIISINRGDATRIAALSATYLDGTVVSTTNGLGNAAYFHGLTAAVATNPIVKFTIINSTAGSGACRFDDLAFIVSSYQAAPPPPVVYDTNAAVSVNFVGVSGNGTGQWGSGFDNPASPSQDYLFTNELAGAPGYARTNWNNFDAWGDVGSGIKDASGSDSGLHIQWDTIGAFMSGAYGNLGGTPDSKLMDGFNDTDWGGGPPGPITANNVYNVSANQKPIVCIGGLQAYMAAKGWTNYAVVMYVNGWANKGLNAHWVQAVASGNSWSYNMVAGADLTPHLINKDTGPFGGTYSQIAVNSTNTASPSSGNFLVFGGLTNDVILLRTAEPTGNYQAGMIMGFQIVEKVIPTTNAPLASTPTISPSATVYAGIPVTLTEVATPDPNDTRLWYQWRWEGGNIADATNSTYAFTPTNAASQYTVNFDVVVTNVFGAVTSSVVTLTVNPAVPPYVTTDTTPGPSTDSTNVYAFANGSVSFSAAFGGPIPITYLWQADTGSGYGSLSGTTNTTLVLTNLQFSNSGNYRLMAHNAYGDTPSTPSPLTVLADPAAPDSSQAYAYAVFNKGPAAYWRFSETINVTTNSMQAYDYSGHNLNATYGHAVYVAGANGLETPTFPGLESGNQTVSLANGLNGSSLTVPSMNLNTNTVTISMWINPNSVIGTYWGLFMWANGSDKAGFGFGSTQSNSIAALGYTWNTNSSATYNWNSGLYPPYGQWSFVSLVITPTNSTIYLYYTDGFGTQLKKAVQSITNSPASFNGGTIWIGSDGYSGRNFDGYIDEVSVFNRSLTEAEIQNLYAIGSGVAGVAPYITSDTSANPANSSNLFPGQVPVQLSAAGAGMPTPGYQWQAGSGGVFTNLTDSGSFSGVNSGTLTINPVVPANYLDYRLLLTNINGSATSSVYALSQAVVPNNGMWTARYQFTNSSGTLWYAAYGSGSYSGRGVLGSGNFWNPIPGGGQYASGTFTSVSDYLDDGSTHSGVTCRFNNASFSIAGATQVYPSTNRAGLLTQYAYYFPGFGGTVTNAITLSVPNGMYNFAFHDDVALSWGPVGTAFTVHGANGDQTGGTTNTAQTAYFINYNTSVVITNVQVANGVLNVDATATHPTKGELSINAVEVQLVSYAAPTAGFSASATNVFVNQWFAFNDQSTPVTNVVWNFGDGTLYTNVNGTAYHAYSAAGTYTVSQTVTGPGGADSVTKVNYITVVAMPNIGTVGMENGGLVLGGTGGIPGQQYRILTSTNLALPLASWTTALTSTFALDGSYGYTNSTPTNAASFYILVSP